MQILGKPCLWMGITERVILGREDNSRTDTGAKFWQTRQLTGGCFSIQILCHAAKVMPLKGEGLKGCAKENRSRWYTLG